MPVHLTRSTRFIWRVGRTFPALIERAGRTAISRERATRHPSTGAGLSALPEEFGRVETRLADTGYYSADNVKACAEALITPYIATKRQKHNRPLEQRLRRTREPKNPPPDEEDDSVVL